MDAPAHPSTTISRPRVTCHLKSDRSFTREGKKTFNTRPKYKLKLNFEGEEEERNYDFFASSNDEPAFLCIST